jgi:hypothetical protein
MSTNKTVMAGERQDATSEGRMVLALEMIADELRLIEESITRFGETNACALDEVSSAEGDRRATDRWENEGGHFQPEFAAEPEIERTLVEHFTVGGYNYTNLEHAIAEAKRARLARAE